REINRRAIAQHLASVETDSGPIARNRFRAALSTFFAWCIAEGLVEANPVTGTEKAPERSRARVLTDQELSAIWNACADGARCSDIARRLILTVQRRDEIAGLRWDEIDPDRRLITLPSERTKNGPPHELPLSPLILAILQTQPRSGEWVFGTRFNRW